MGTRVLEVNVDDMGYGGVFTLVRNVIQNKPKNIRIDIAAIEKFERKENIESFKAVGTKVYYVGYKGNKIKKQFVCFKKLGKLLRNKNYDCVHIHADVSNKLLVSGLAAKKAGVKKIILHSHSSGVDNNHRGLKKIFHFACRRMLKYIGTDYAACSNEAARWMFPNIGLNNVNIISNGIDLERFRFDEKVRLDVRKQLGINDEILIGHVGRFGYTKNHKFLIEIMKEIRKRDINAKLLLVGEGPDEEKIRSLVKAEGLEKSIIFYGTSDEVEKLYMAMDVFALPSHFEGFGIVGIEAQASGLQTIFSVNVPKKAKFREGVYFLTTANKNIGTWVDLIVKVSGKTKNREEAYRDLKGTKADLIDTVNRFMELYD